MDSPLVADQGDDVEGRTGAAGVGAGGDGVALTAADQSPRIASIGLTAGRLARRQVGGDQRRPTNSSADMPANVGEVERRGFVEQAAQESRQPRRARARR